MAPRLVPRRSPSEAIALWVSTLVGRRGAQIEGRWLT